MGCHGWSHDLVMTVFNKKQVVARFDKNIGMPEKSTHDPKEESIIEDPEQELLRTHRGSYHSGAIRATYL